MRICSILTSLTSGGAENLVCNLCEKFNSNGHGSTILTLADAVQLGNLAATERRMADMLAGSGVNFRSLSLGAGRGLIPGALALRRALAQLDPEIVHTHTARAGLMLALTRPRAPVVLTHHNSKLSFSPKLFPILDTIVARYVAISGESADVIRRYSRRPVRIIHNGADSRFQVPAPRSTSAQDPIVLAVGMLSEQKSYPTLIRAANQLAKRLSKSGRKPKIFIVGDGPSMADLDRLIRTSGVQDIVDLLGVRSDVIALTRSADLFVNCSIYEGLPIAIIEAMMAGLPVVATDVAGNRELVQHGVNGLLVPAGDAGALANAMADVLERPLDYAAFSRASIDRSDGFTMDACAQSHLQLYKETLRAAT